MIIQQQQQQLLLVERSHWGLHWEGSIKIVTWQLWLWAWIDPAINYYKVQYAQLCIHQNNKGCLFIATNLDMVFPTEGDQDWAAGGAMVGGIVMMIYALLSAYE
jgi:hypothetical protein